MNSISIQLGAFAPPLKEQLPNLPEDVVEHAQQDSDAITRLAIRGILTEAETTKARQRMLKRLSNLSKDVS